MVAIGDNRLGQCGYPMDSTARKVNVVVRADTLQPLYCSAVACGDAHSFFMAVHGETFACGDNRSGQLGVGDTEPRAGQGAHLVLGLLGVPIVQIDAGTHHSAALTACGNVYTWGSNSLGQLGLEGRASISSPLMMQFFAAFPVTRIACAANHTFAVTKAGDAYGFGDSSRNQICIKSSTREIGAEFICKKPHLVSSFGSKSVRVCELALNAAGGLAIVVDPESKIRQVWGWGTGMTANGYAEQFCSSEAMRLLSLSSLSVGGNTLAALASSKVPFDFAPAKDGEQEEVFTGAPALEVSFAHIDGPMATEMLKLAREAKGSLPELGAYVHFVLSHPACLNASFLGESIRFRHNGLNSGLEMNQVRAFFIDMQKFSSPILYNAMLEGAGNAIQYLYDHRLAHSTEILRMFLILLDSPILLNPDQRNRKLLDQILFCMLGLPQQLKTCLLSYIGEHTPLYFVMPVQIFERYLTFLIQSGGHEQSISNCVVFLSFMNQINEVKKHIPYADLYNEALNSFNTALLEREYWKWRNRQLSFCQYPFLLSAQLKSEVLQIDATVSMKEQMESAIISSVLRGEGVAPFLVLVIRRDYLIQDALAQVQSKPSEQLKKPLKVKFVGEEGIDAGGVRKEFFQLVVRGILDPNYGMFSYREKERLFWFNLSANDMTAEFQLVGTILGLAIYNSVILDLPMPFLVYKQLSGKAVGMEDLRDFDIQTFNNLTSLLEYAGDDVEDVYCLDFSVSYDYFGSDVVVDLMEDGRNIAVTQENKQQYVKLYVHWLLQGSIQKQLDSFARGFRAVGGPTLTIFRPEELELLVCGSENVDIDELQNSTIYKGGYSAQHKVIKWFWELVRTWDVVMQKKLLTFATGSDRVPIKGLSSLQFVVQCNSQDSSRLPTASTCFNTLLLPAYPSKAILKEKLEIAVENNTSFGLK